MALSVVRKPAEAVKNAPVTSVTAAHVVVAGVLAYLVSRGTITEHAVEQWVWAVPLVEGLVGALLWRLVSPYKKVRAVLEKEHVLSDADFGRLESIVAEWVTGGHEALTVGDHHPDAERIGAPAVPTRQAGSEYPAPQAGGAAEGTDPTL